MPFNFINHPNLGAADASPTSATFGRVVTKANSQMQVSLRYPFYSQRGREAVTRPPEACLGQVSGLE